MSDDRSFIEKYGVNVGAAIYASACVAEFSTFRSMNIVSAACMTASIAFNLAAGHTKRGLMLGAGFGLAGTIAGAAEEICGLKIKSVAGAALAVTGLGLIAASKNLTERFQHSSNRFLRISLGQPRKWGGRMLMASGALIMFDKLSAGALREAFYYAMLTIGDYPVSLSKPAMRTPSIPSAKAEPR
jgi:hypothetical protein